MPGLTKRGAPRLLRTVKNKPHATPDDHVDPLPTPPSTNGKSSTGSIENEDLSREPYDSDEDEMAKFSLPSGTLNDNAITINTATFAVPRKMDGTRDESENVVTFRQPASLVPKTTEIQNAHISQTASSDTDSMVFEGMRDNTRKRRKVSDKTLAVANIFQKPGRQQVYGKSGRHSWQGSSTKRSRAAAATTPKTQDNTPAKLRFKRAKGIDLFEFGKPEPQLQFQRPRCATEMDKQGYERPLSCSPSRSSLSKPPSEDEIAVSQQDLPKPKDYRPECAICGEAVSVLLKEEFENQYTDGKTMLNYKWQQRFCRWHKEQDAKRVRDEKGYPEVDWNRLERRMRRQHRHLKDVMKGSKPSFYRDQLSEKIKERSKTTMQMLNNDGAKRGASVGYYGPRGERVMTEHIVNHLSDQLREQSSKDKLVAAAGVSGGVSGFVQAVLVPELAEQLVMEDLKASSQRAREIIAESVDLGELLYPDVDDKVAEVVEL